jgi:hypothetical protein
MKKNETPQDDPDVKISSLGTYLFCQDAYLLVLSPCFKKVKHF